MIALISEVVPWDWVFGIGAVFTAFFLAFVSGGKSQRQRSKIDAQSGYINTTKAVQDAEISDDIGVLRERMRERDPRKP